MGYKSRQELALLDRRLENTREQLDLLEQQRKFWLRQIEQLEAGRTIVNMQIDGKLPAPGDGADES